MDPEAKYYSGAHTLETKNLAQFTPQTKNRLRNPNAKYLARKRGTRVINHAKELQSRGDIHL